MKQVTLEILKNESKLRGESDQLTNCRLQNHTKGNFVQLNIGSTTLARVQVGNNLFYNQMHMTSFLQEIWRIPYFITYAFQITIVFTFLPLSTASMNLILYTNFTKRMRPFIVQYFPYYFSQGPSTYDVRFFQVFFDLPTYPCPILPY